MYEDDGTTRKKGTGRGNNSTVVTGHKSLVWEMSAGGEGGEGFGGKRGGVIKNTSVSLGIPDNKLEPGIFFFFFCLVFSIR